MEEQKGLEFDLKHIVKLLLGKLWLIATVSVLCAAMLFAYVAYFVADTYTVTAQMWISNVVDAPNIEQVGMTSSDVIAATSLVDTYSVILKNDYSIKQILAETGLAGTYSAAQLKSMITAYAVNESLILEIQVTSPDPQHSQEIANQATKILKEYDLRGASATPLHQVETKSLDASDSKGTVAKALLGFLLGAVMTSLVLIFLDMRRDTIHSDDWLKEKYGESIPVLAIIPDVNGSGFKNGKRKKYGYYARYGYYRAKPDQTK